MEGESWSAAFDPAMLEEDSEVMAQLFGSQEMFWSDQINADSYFFTEYYDEPSMNMAASAINGEQVAIPSFPVSIRMNEEMISSSKIADSTEKSRVPPKRKIEEDEDDGDDIPVEVPTRRPRASAPVTKRGKKAQNKKKARKSASEEAINADVNPQSSSCYSSEDDSNGSLELKGAGSMSSSSKGEGKKRADRGTATDPQSLYARKRRERINERLKILQKLVPNGTKVDISTMLEEAVQYVKFLQLQIKLLSSDELWMYAPIAYNGMNLGFDLKISGL